MKFRLCIVYFQFFCEVRGKTGCVCLICRLGQLKCSGGIFPAFAGLRNQGKIPFPVLPENFLGAASGIDPVFAWRGLRGAVVENSIGPAQPHCPDAEPFKKIQFFFADAVPGIEHSSENGMFPVFPFAGGQNAVRGAEHLPFSTAESQFKISQSADRQRQSLSGDGCRIRPERKNALFYSPVPCIGDFQFAVCIQWFGGTIADQQFRFRRIPFQQNVAVAAETECGICFLF